MEVTALLADPQAITLETIRSNEKSLTLIVRVSQRPAQCPRCNCTTARVHSRYVRRVADLPWLGVAVRLELQTRRFFCANTLCTQQIFCERLPSVVARYTRRTARLNEALTFIGFLIGGEAGARIARELGMTTSPDTLIRRIRQSVLPQVPTPRVLGVDDWAKRKGQTYGTILVDLERRRPIDLLPDREANTLAAWLKDHPSVEVVSRDRFQAYREGVTNGAPSAVQVADRWHLLKNLTEALERWLNRQRCAIHQAAKDVATPTAMLNAESAATDAVHASVTHMQQRSMEQQAARLSRFQEVKELFAQGATIKGIATKFRMHRRTVRLFLNADECPQRAPPRRRPNKLAAYLPYLKQRWTEGCHNASELWREIKAQGYAGSESALRHLVAEWRLNVAPELRRKRQLASGAPTRRVTIPGARTVTWLLIQDESKLNDKQRTFVTRLCEQQPEVVIAQQLVRRFQHLVSSRDVSAFDEWLTEARNSKLPELVNFAAGLAKDAAVRAALTTAWSNGQVEGQVNRLKMIKRQMFGRANFDLLRHRVLHLAT
jgi:transposase